MLDEDQVAELRGQTLLDVSEQEVGTVEEVFLVPGDDQPAFAAVSFEGRRVIVPLDEADISDGQITVRYDREAIEGAPETDAEALDPELERAVYDHYGIADADIRDDSGFSARAESRDQPDSSRDPRGDQKADDSAQTHP
ncbi:MAG: PRC-barrel domain-containing protein [Actinomycetota bacterium]|nr:PRC-barrel domain-containing protein [Actinomycetota bacterium]